MRSVLVVLLAAALVACNRDENGDADETATETRDTTPKARPAIYSEPEAIGVLHAISDAEIAMARVARERSQNDAVLAYAGVMIADHEAFKQAFSMQASDNAETARIRAEGDSIARALASLQGGLNNTYMEEQVKAHQRALQLLDTAVVPSVRDSAVRNLLTQARPTVVAHLQRAMQLLSERRRQAQERGEPWVSGLPQAGDSAYVAPAPRPAPPTDPQPQPMPLPRPQPQPQQPRPEPEPRPQPQDTTPPPTTTSDE